MGGGILPVAIVKGQLYFLFSREWNRSKDDPGKWSDFGGSREKKETYKQTAIREGYEESCGFLGSKKKIEQLMNNKTIAEITYKGYRTYVVLIDYDNKLPSKFRKKFLDTLKSKPTLVTNHNGLYEKDMVRWYSYDDIKKKFNQFRPWYRNIVKLILQTL